MEQYILQKDVELQGHKYRFAIFEMQEKDGIYFYSIFAEIFEEETFELIHGGRFVSEEAAKGDLKHVLYYLVHGELTFNHYNEN
ncbi:MULTISPECIES: hypothetical protein [Niallia]|uniref:Uncharacterized protein n=1 Tax=Niallia alba TaxID=2729105 RepID=A0A7Y0K595_9BACI|nr:MULTISPECIES: hypothetical protein [Niallia]NMO75703.1 hypothetical protein [Niallia alba]UTI43501.1 hypothetical protein NKG37_07445 [Niallia sp. RD1]